MYEDWYTSAQLGLLDHQTDWYYTPAKDEDKVSLIILNTGACQRREIISCHWLWERFTDCLENLSGRCGALWQAAAAGGSPGCTVKIFTKDWITALCFRMHLFHCYHVCPRRHCKSLLFLSSSHLLLSNNIIHSHIIAWITNASQPMICLSAVQLTTLLLRLSPGASLFFSPGISRRKVRMYLFDGQHVAFECCLWNDYLVKHGKLQAYNCELVWGHRVLCTFVWQFWLAITHIAWHVIPFVRRQLSHLFINLIY